MSGHRPAALWTAAGGAMLGGLLLALPPFLREIAWVLVKACTIAVAAYAVFVFLAMRGGR